jgi:hypothetical protein
MKSTLLISLLLLARALAAAPEPAAPDPLNKVEVLARHETIATLKGIAFRQCLGLTSLCPERCGDSGEFATFSINRYLAYTKNGEYGDPKQTEYLVQVSDFTKQPKGDPKVLAWIKSLKVGDTVTLTWEHRYVTHEGSSSPVRVLVNYESMHPEK